MYLKYVENVIPLSKLIGLLFLFCLPLLSILFLKTKRNDLARPVMGTIFLVIVILSSFCALQFNGKENESFHIHWITKGERSYVPKFKKFISDE